MLKVMNLVSWRRLLPAVLLALALACHVYDTHVFRVESHRRRKEVTLEFYAEHRPAWPVRASEGISFPALVLAYPLKGAQRPIFDLNSEYTGVSICPYDLGFFLGIVLFWYLVGRMADERWQRAAERTWPRKVRIAGFCGAVVFGMLTGTYANCGIAGNHLPARQVGAVGMVWASVLIAYFAWELAREFRPEKVDKIWLFAGVGVLLMVAALWVGGPFGATQALGEYLRPTTVNVMPLAMENCAVDEPPPAKLMGVVESERTADHLTLQRVTVCTTDHESIQDEAGISQMLSGEYGGWPPLKAGCCIYQYRRHVAMFFASPSGTGSVIVQADMIQSRWDFLRLNWSKMRGEWSWPYPKVPF